MRALLLPEATGPEALTLSEVDEPSPVEGMCLVDVHAAGVGFVDYLITRGEYQITFPTPFVPGSELAGVVREAPEGSGLTPGDRVLAMTMPGAYAETALTPPFMTFAIPGDMPYETAAGLVINHQTAHLALKLRGRLAPGESVLVHGAAGGVGVASLQVARALDAGTVIAVASSEEKRALALEQGADHALDPEDDWVAQVKELTGGRGADVVVDPVGGDVFNRSLRCMAPFGRILVVGFAAGTIPEVKVNRLLLRSHDVVGVNFGGLLAVDPSFARAAHEELMAWWAAGRIAAVPGEQYAFEDGGRALSDLGQRRAAGKPIIRIRG